MNIKINIDRLSEIIEKKANKGIEYLNTLKMFTPEYRETLDSILAHLDAAKKISRFDIDCPDCVQEMKTAKPEELIEEAPENNLNGREFPGDPTKIVLFFSDSCEPCSHMKPLLEEIAEETGVLLEKIEVSSSNELIQDFNITSYPTALFIKDNIIVENLIGYSTNTPRETNKEFILDVIKHTL